MLGAIIGDIVGSAYEFNRTNDYDFEMFKDGSGFTDDTICTVAVADAILNRKDYGKSLHEWCRRYPNPKGGYGGRFREWVMSENPEPYNSLGNGSAMRVSPIAWAWKNLVPAMHEATKSAECTHNHPEGIKGAEAVVMAIHFGDEIRRLSPVIDKYVILDKLSPVLEYSRYDIDIRRENVLNEFDETCPGTVPVALWIISESKGFEDAIRKAVSLGADADTLGAIVGSIAEAIWGIPEELALKAMSYLPSEMKNVVEEFYSKYCWEIYPLRGHADFEQTKTMMLWQLGLGNMSKFFNGEDPMPSKEKRATFNSWDVDPMPHDDISEIPMYYELSEDKMRILKQGHIPEAQEDHWFMCVTRNYIRYYRSLTGMCAFVAHYHKDHDKYIIDSLMMNHALDQFAVNGEEPAKMLFLYLISSETDGFNHGLWNAYLNAWEKQAYKNIEMAKEREKTEKEREEFRSYTHSSIEKMKAERLEARQRQTEGASHYMHFEIAGTGHIKDQSIFYTFREDDIVTLRYEHNNKYDENAVAVYFVDTKVGYVPRKDNREIAKLLRQGWEKVFVSYVSDWRGCGKNRHVTVHVMIKPFQCPAPFGFDEEAFKSYTWAEERQLHYSSHDMRISPDKINSLRPDEVFVFGSNAQGHHIGGAAKAAMSKFGAVWGEGDGLFGQSYAISTMEGLLQTARNVNRFIHFAAEHQELKFFVTPIGCGIAGYNPLQIAPLFRKAITLPNVYLPRIFWEYYWQTEDQSPEYFRPDADWKKWDSK